jgi:transposase
MPAKNVTKRPQHVIDKAVKRHLEGESGVALAKEHKVSPAGFYLWVKKYKEALLEKSKRNDMSPQDAETADKRALIAEIQALKLENRKLRELAMNALLKISSD